MRPLAFALLAVAPAAVVWIALSPRKEPPAARAVTGDDPVARARIERLEDAIAEFQRELDGTRSELASLRGAILAMVPPQGPEGAGPEAYLDEYARSFAGGGKGSEYFRLVVDAYAPALRDALLRTVADTSAPLALRASLVPMLGRPEFRGDGRVIAVLVDVLRTEPQLAQSAVQALRAIGDARTGATLEALVNDLQQPARNLAVAAAVDLSADGPNAAVARLLAGARDAATKAQLVQALRGGDDANALQVLRGASRMETQVRLPAAQKLGTFRGEPFRQLVDDWLGHEADRGVREALEKAKQQQDQVPSWHELKATGPPDAEAGQDHPNAWASRQPDAGREWLELSYDPPRRASGVRIFEVNVAGGVVEVETVDEGGTRRSAWKGNDPTATPGVLEVAFAPTGYRVRAVRIILDTSRKPGWEEIDAVELLGPDGRAWATGASASSSYAQR